jgi:hypothetical protein
MTRSRYLNLVDLAGSERSKDTGASGHRLKEANSGAPPDTHTRAVGGKKQRAAVAGTECTPADTAGRSPQSTNRSPR